MTTTEPATYSGWQSERSGFIGNLSGPGFALVAAACVFALIPLYIHSLSSALFALPVAAVLLLLAYGRVLGLTADQWIVLAVRHQFAVATSKNLFFSGIFAPRTKDGQQPMDLPGTLARLHLLEAPDGLGGQLGLMHNPVDHTYTAVCRLSHSGLALVDTARQNNRVGAWAAFLRSHCKEDGAITRIAVHQRSLPDDGAALRSWTERHISEDAPAPAVKALDQLMAGAGPAATIRETYLAVTLSAFRARLAIKGAGGGQRGAAAVLVRELNAMQPALSSAGLQVAEWLTPRGVAQTIRTAYDPEAHVMLAERNEVAATVAGWQGTSRGVAPELAGPAAAEAQWGVYRHDGAWTVSYQVRGFPQSPVYATFLQPLLRPRPNARRSMSITYEPVGPAKARKELAREKTKRDAARGLRAKTGRSESEDERREAMTARAQDMARAAGHGVLRLTALVAVTVLDLDELEIACADLQADASAAGLELRRVWGAQDDAFAASALPLGQGLPERRVGI
ncbi:PrgI family protein (plasmid) [Streptomyces sp. NBC_01795]|uniref:SCO6880 family protein n=1 Tax=unclassified Streptomyces TaxID=2593676 RepID=UPI002DDC215B|nr:MULTISPECIES: SCO6880 family protein [unclassified Streptomyces]WSA97684.1 PrgI family protein [Streptomyces sp. NBC_01795]WSB82065.1 PrgI family protein [Streptomyces sp. NBC_01775]